MWATKEHTMKILDEKHHEISGTCCIECLNKRRVELNLLYCCVLIVSVFAERRWEKIISIEAFSRWALVRVIKKLNAWIEWNTVNRLNVTIEWPDEECRNNIFYFWNRFYYTNFEFVLPDCVVGNISEEDEEYEIDVYWIAPISEFASSNKKWRMSFTTNARLSRFLSGENMSILVPVQLLWVVTSFVANKFTL